MKRIFGVTNQINKMKNLEITKEQLTNGNSIIMHNEDDQAEFFFNEKAKRFNIMFNSQIIFGCKTFTHFKEKCLTLITSKSLQF